MRTHILHLNIANFYIAVARVVQPHLFSYPVAVVTPGMARRVLIDVSQEASGDGLYKGMLLDVAKRRCPRLVVLHPSPQLYERACAAILDEVGRLSPRVEPAGPGHFFVDLTGTERLLGVSMGTGDRLRKTIKAKFRLDPAVGLARNKLVSKIATRVVKPTGICEIMEGGEADFMAPLPITYLPGLDHKFTMMLVQFNIKLIGDLLSFKEESFYEAFGARAHEIHRLARGEDDTPVREYTAPEPSIRKTFLFRGQTNDDKQVENALFQLVSQCGFTLRKMRLGTKRAELVIRYADGVSRQRSLNLNPPLCGDLSIFEKLLPLARALYTRRIRLSTLSLRLSHLSFPYGQLDLLGRVDKERNLMRALDSIRTRFGPAAISFCGRQTDGRGLS